jgi:two-component system, LytTR family, response regulator AlgR
MTALLTCLLVDDEALARSRLRTLLADCRDPHATVLAEAADALAATQWLGTHACDVVLLDIHMPGADGLRLAQTLQQLPAPPAVVFVTAHAEHAVSAFELDAVDYLTKPVRLERLQQALRKAQLAVATARARAADAAQAFVVIHDRGRSERVPLHDIVYLKAELKYVTVRTRDRSLIYDGSLSEFEARHGAHWLRIHRNALVARHAIRALEKHHDVEEGDGWAVRLNGVDEPLAVSRRQLAGVREVLGKG